jgi:hypothetical protein
MQETSSNVIPQEAPKARRQRRYRAKKKVAENAAADNVNPESKKDARVNTRRQRQNEPTKDAPEVVAEPKEPREPLRPVDGRLEMRVSLAKPRTAYCRIVRLYLSGVDSSGRKIENGEVNRVQLTALGSAIGSAIFISDDLVKNNVCRSVSVETEFAQVESRKAAKITINLEKLPTWVAAQDEVLLKDQAHRKAKTEESQV